MDGGGWIGAAEERAQDEVSVARGTLDSATDRGRGGGDPYEFQTLETLTLGDIEREIRASTAFVPRAGDRALDVHAVRAHTRDGRVVRVDPVATADALFVDARDLAALRARAIVPGLEGALGSLRRLGS